MDVQFLKNYASSCYQIFKSSMSINHQMVRLGSLGSDLSIRDYVEVSCRALSKIMLSMPPILRKSSSFLNKCDGVFASLVSGEKRHSKSVHPKALSLAARFSVSGQEFSLSSDCQQLFSVSSDHLQGLTDHLQGFGVSSGHIKGFGFCTDHLQGFGVFNGHSQGFGVSSDRLHGFSDSIASVEPRATVCPDLGVDSLAAHEAALHANFAFTLCEWVQANSLEDWTPLRLALTRYCALALTVTEGEVEFWSRRGVLPSGAELRALIRLTRSGMQKEEQELLALKQRNLELEATVADLGDTLRTEREIQKCLNATIEEVEQDLSDTFQQKGRLQRLATAASRLLARLAALGEDQVQPEFPDDEDDPCFCEGCASGESEAVHKAVTTRDCLASVAGLKRRLEREREEMAEIASRLQDSTSDLRDSNSRLHATLDEREKEVLSLRSEVDAFRHDLRLEKESADRKGALIAELESQMSAVLNECASKDHDERLSKSQNTSFDVNTAAASAKVDDLLKEIESLKKINGSLSLTVDSVEEELRVVFEEKESAMRDLKLASDELVSAREDLRARQIRYESQEEVAKEMAERQKESEAALDANQRLMAQLQAKYESFEKDVVVLRSIKRDQENMFLAESAKRREAEATSEQLRQKVGALEAKNRALSDDIEELKLICEEQEVASHQQRDGNPAEVLAAEMAEVRRENEVLAGKLRNLKSELDSLLQATAEASRYKAQLESANSDLAKALAEASDSKSSLERKLSSLEKDLKVLGNQLAQREEECAKLRRESAKPKDNEENLLQKALQVQNNLMQTEKKVDMLLNDKNLLTGMLHEAEGLLVKSESECLEMKEFLMKLFESLVEVLNDLDSPDFNALQYHLTSSIENGTSNKYQTDVLGGLHSFLKAVAASHSRKTENEELFASVADSIQKIRQGFELNAADNRDSSGCFGNVSAIDESFTRNFDSLPSISPSSISIELKQTVKLADDSLSRLKTVIERQNREISKLKKSVEHNTSEKRDSSNPEAKDSDKNSYKWKFNQVLKQYKRLESSYKDLAKSLSEKKERIEELEDENELLQKRCGESEIAELAGLGHRARGLEGERDSLLAWKSQLQEEISELKERVAELGARNAELALQAAQLEELAGEKEGLVLQLEGAGIKLAQSRKRLEELERENSLLARQCEQRQESEGGSESRADLVRELQEENGLLKRRYEQLEELCREQVSSVEDKVGRIQALESRNASVVDMYRKLESTYKELLAYHEKMKVHIKALETESGRVLEQYKLLHGTHRQLAESQKEKDERIKRLEEENRNLDQEADELANEVKKLEAKYYSSTELSEALESLAETKKRLSETEGELAYLHKCLREREAASS